MFNLKLSPLKNYFVSFYHIPYPKTSKIGLYKGAGTLVYLIINFKIFFKIEIIPRVDFSITNCFKMILNFPYLIYEFKQSLIDLHILDNQQFNIMIDKLKSYFRGNRKLKILF